MSRKHKRRESRTKHNFDINQAAFMREYIGDDFQPSPQQEALMQSIVGVTKRHEIVLTRGPRGVVQPWPRRLTPPVMQGYHSDITIIVDEAASIDEPLWSKLQAHENDGFWTFSEQQNNDASAT